MAKSLGVKTGYFLKLGYTLPYSKYKTFTLSENSLKHEVVFYLRLHNVKCIIHVPALFQLIPSKLQARDMESFL